MDPGFRRKKIRLPAHEYVGRKHYFITLCCEKRQKLLQGQLAEWVRGELFKVSEQEGFAIHAYCVMPDHLHFLAEGKSEKSNLLHFVWGFKHHTAKAYERKTRERLWQRKFYDHILRRGDSIDSVAWYIWMNPVRQGICATVQEYPFSGSLTIEKPSTSPALRWTPPWRRNVGSHTARPAAT